MTQIKQGLFKSPALTYVVTSVEDNGLSKDKSPSPELISLLSAAATGMLAFGELWDTIKTKGADEGFDEKQLLALFAPMVKDKFTAAQMRYLVNKEKEQERARDNRAKQKEELKSLRTYADIPPKKDKEQSKGNNKPPEIPPPPPEDEEPTPLELAQIEIQQLKDVIKKTEQFKRATQLAPPREEPLTDEIAFQYLRDRAKETGNILIIDRVSSGALVQALAQYKNSFGVAELFLRVIQ